MSTRLLISVCRVVVSMSLVSGVGRVGGDSWRRRRVYRQAIRPVHARLHRRQLRAKHRLLLLRRPPGGAGHSLLPLPPGLEPLPLRRVGRRRPNTRVRRYRPLYDKIARRNLETGRVATHGGRPK